MLIAVAALSPVNGLDPQDQSRLCLTQALVHGHVSNDRCLAEMFDKSSYAGHLYSDKAPGLSVIELPVEVAVRLPAINTIANFSLRVWAIRVLSSGVAFIGLAFLIGRISEGLAPGFGGISLVAFALGTLVMPFASSNFAELPAAALCFGAFVLAWRRRPLSAGLLAGTAAVIEYQAASLLAIIGLYVALSGWRSLLRYVAGASPLLVLLLVYDTLAFGRPWHLSYSYVSNQLADQQANGLFGIGLPHAFGIYSVLSGSGGLLVASPVLVAAGWGLVLFGRRHRVEAIVCAVVTALFFIIDSGYFLPYGGVSPGPRFLIPCLPFLALGLGPAFAWKPRLTALLAALSIVPMTAFTLIWQSGRPVRQTIWGELGRVPVELGSSQFVHALTKNVVDWLGAGRAAGAVIVALAASAAFVVALVDLPSRRAAGAAQPSSRGAVLAVAASLCLIAVADASAAFAYPYGWRSQGTAISSVPLQPTISGSTIAALPGGEVDFTVVLSNPTTQIVGGVTLILRLSSGMQLLGPPSYERGSGCRGTSTISCNLDFLLPEMSTPIHLGVRIAADAGPTETLVAEAASAGHASSHTAKFVVQVGS